MAIYRLIHTSYWQDNFILNLTPEEKFFYLYLMTNTKTSQSGIYELPIKIIEFETGYNWETVEKLLNRFIEYDKIDYCFENNEIYLKNWLKHNPINNINVEKRIIKELEDVKNESFRADFLVVAEENYIFKTLEAPTKPLISPYVAPTKPLPSPYQEHNKNNNKNKIKNNNNNKECVVVDLLNEIDDLSYKEALNDFINHRKALKKPLTERAFKMILKKLDSVSVALRIKAIDEAIINNWQSVFPKEVKEVKNPDWYGKYQKELEKAEKNKSNQLTEEEIDKVLEETERDRL